MTTDIEPAAPAAAPAAARPGFLRRNRIKFVLLAIPVLGLALFAAYLTVVLKFSYSQGERVGYVQKLSKKGWVCRTWEGELAMNPVPGSAPQIFSFSLRDDNLATELARHEGKRVALSYEEKKGIPSTCFGETNYFVTGVRELKF